MLKVYLGGEGNNDIGTRWYAPMGKQPGVVEALLRRVRPTGWHVAGARSWKSIRKYRTGAANGHAAHADAHNVRGLVLHAYEEACEMLVFVRDRDNDDSRESAIRSALALLASADLAREFHYELAIVGGIAKPNLEGWILCLLGLARTDEMSTDRTKRELDTADIPCKSTADYVDIAETRPLPAGEGSLAEWLAHAGTTFRRLIDGELTT